MAYKEVTFERDDGTEITVQLPAHWVICGTCDGDGKSSAHLGAFTQDEWAQEDDDFKQDYLDGVYDLPCPECGGSGKVMEIEREACTSPEQVEALEYLDVIAQLEADEASERRMMARMSGDWS